MKKILFFLMLVITVIATSCTSVDSKERGVKKSWGVEVDVKNVYEPGMHYGANWLWDDMITFDVSQQTIVEKYEFNDKNNMGTGVEVSLDYSMLTPYLTKVAQIQQNKLDLLNAEIIDLSVKNVELVNKLDSLEKELEGIKSMLSSITATNLDD